MTHLLRNVSYTSTNNDRADLISFEKLLLLYGGVDEEEDVNTFKIKRKYIL